MRRPVIAVLVFLLASAAARADDAAAELSARLAPLARLSGHFEQSVSGGGTATASHSAGRFSLRRPGQFRWEILEPDSQLLIANDGVLWHYDRDLATATRRRLDGDASAPLLLLAADAAALDAAFTVEGLGADRYRVIPRSGDAGFEAAELTFTGTLPATMRIIDPLGQTIDIRFSQLLEDPLPAGTFAFTPPSGVDVYRDDD